MILMCNSFLIFSASSSILAVQAESSSTSRIAAPEILKQCIRASPLRLKLIMAGAHPAREIRVGRKYRGAKETYQLPTRRSRQNRTQVSFAGRMQPDFQDGRPTQGSMPHICKPVHRSRAKCTFLGVTRWPAHLSDSLQPPQRNSKLKVDWILLVAHQSLSTMLLGPALNTLLVEYRLLRNAAQLSS